MLEVELKRQAGIAKLLRYLDFTTINLFPIRRNRVEEKRATVENNKALWPTIIIAKFDIVFLAPANRVQSKRQLQHFLNYFKLKVYLHKAPFV